MESQTAPRSATTTAVSPETDPDSATIRANTYTILSALLSNTPSADLLDFLRHIPDSAAQGGEMAAAWHGISSAAAEVDPATLDSEYHRLFIGLGKGEVVPFGSWHLTGFLMEKPLSELRDDLRRLGIEADENHKDPEDHIAALFECMAIAIQSADIDESLERQFFTRHIHSWAQRFFSDLETAPSSNFYRHVGVFGRSFLALEAEYLNIQNH